MELGNRAAHVVIGALVGWGLGRAAWRPTALFAGALFAVYQAIERWSIRDEGYRELREFGWGLAIAALARWWMGNHRLRGRLRDWRGGRRDRRAAGGGPAGPYAGEGVDGDL